MDKAIIKAKKVECIIGLFFLLPPVFGVIAFVFEQFGATILKLSSTWTARVYEGGGMSAAPVYLGLMAIAGVYLIKDSFYAFFTKNEQDKNKIVK